MEDLEGWEVLPDDGFLEIHEDGGKKIFSSKYGGGSNNVLKNYFICPSPKSSQFVESTTEHSRVPKQLVPLPIQLDPEIHKIPDHEEPKEFTKVPIQINIDPSAMAEKVTGPNMGPDQDPVSQVFFKKMKENEFVDMKMDSPRSNNSWGIKPQIDAGNFQFEEKGEVLESKISSPKLKNGEEKMKMDSDEEKEVNWEENSGGLNIWKWGMTGIGAICSFGVAAATVCIIILGGQKNKHQENHKLQFHIYADDKRLKQVVHHATKLNEAISAGRGVPLARAHITVGGYYEGL